MTRRAAVAGLLLQASCAVQPPPVPDAGPVASASGGADRIALMRDAGERIAGAPFLPGNRVTLLVDGPAAFAALSAAIAGARIRIDMESYEFDRVAGGQFADRLIAARARGVDVHLIYDAWGSLETPANLFARLRAAGVHLVEYNPLRPGARLLEVNDRDHRKLLCVDGGLAITGGVNIGREYENRPTASDDPAEEVWRDTDVRIEGPVVAQFDRHFAQTWREQGGGALPPAPSAPAALAAGVPVQALAGAPVDGRPLIYRTLLAAIALAGRSVHLTTGFFVPTPDLAAALAAAARRGVDVRLVVPGRSTSDASVAAGRADYGDLLRAGVQVHEFQGRILHAKTAVVDGAWVAVGSSNLDWRSTVWNNEIDAIVLSPALGARMEAVFAADAGASHMVTLDAWRRRGLRERLREWRAVVIERLL